MKIFLLTMEWPPFGCGIGSYMFNLARGLSAFGHEVTVITHDQGPIPLAGVSIFSVPVFVGHPSSIDKIKKKVNEWLYGIVHPWSWHAHQLFQKIIQSESFDIIETAEFGAWGWHFLNNGKVPVVVRCHNPAHVVWSINQTNWLNGWPFPSRLQKQDHLERMQTARADAIAAPSEALACHLSLGWTIPLSHFQVIPNLIDAELFSPASIAKESKEILYVGRLEFNKGVYDLAQALPPILEKYPEVTARLVGMDRPVAEPYRKFGATASQAILGLIPQKYHKRVVLTAPVPVSEIVRFQQRAMCAVMPTRGFENFPYTVMEPMACGTPVIATRCGGPSEIITHGTDGLLVPPGRPVALTNAIQLLVNDPDLCSRLSIMARKMVEEKYSFSAVLPKIINWYEEVISEYKRN